MIIVMQGQHLTRLVMSGGTSKDNGEDSRPHAFEQCVEGGGCSVGSVCELCLASGPPLPVLPRVPPAPSQSTQELAW